MTRRDFLRFFLLGGILGFLGKKMKALKTESQKAMFWRKIS